MTKNVKIDDVNYKFDGSRIDPGELLNRKKNYLSCVKKFVAMYPYPLDIKNQLKRADINRLCLFELVAMRKFADDTDFRYENFYHKIDPFVKDNYEY